MKDQYQKLGTKNNDDDFEVLNVETTYLKSYSISILFNMICLERRPIFVCVAKQAFSAVGVGIRPKAFLPIWGDAEGRGA